MHLKTRWIDRRVYEYFAVNVGPWLMWRNPILVYQMGKVGSSSVRNSLFRCHDASTKVVLMSHEFFPIRNRDAEQIEIEPGLRAAVLREIEHDRRVFEQFSLRNRLGWRFREKFYTEQIYKAYVQPGRPLRAITLVREPVANNISMFFEVFEHYTGNTIGESNMDIPTMIELFLERYMHFRPLTWFDAELKRTLGIDVFQNPFPQSQGYTVASSGNRSLLVLKSESDDLVKSRAIADFLGLDNFELVRSNVSSQRSHAQPYEEFKRQIKVPEALLDQLYNSKYAQFFYSAAERSRFRARWSGRAAESISPP